MLSVEAREAADTTFQVFSRTQLRIKPSLPCFVGERSNHNATKLACLFQLFAIQFKNKAVKGVTVA